LNKIGGDTMRVVGGKHRSRKLLEVDKDTTRETRDRVKESVFNSIQADLFDAHVLDLFAGSGALGIEALSRGSEFCTFIDCNQAAIDTIKDNIKHLKLEVNSLVLKTDYLGYLESTNSAFDIILLDPPYDMHVLDKTIETIASKKLLNKSGILVLFYHKSHSIKNENYGIIEYKQKKYGITKVSFMKWGNEK
jgi:16S rRNA (guanine(966)-N(2))-methyltransferase RsmD